MLSKQGHIEHWQKTAVRDWKAVKQLYEGKSYINALFFAHLVLEKLCKAHWIKYNTGNHPPRIHNLVRIVEQTDLKFTDEELDFLRKMNDFQMEGRYPDYKDTLYRVYKAVQTQKYLNRQIQYANAY